MKKYLILILFLICIAPGFAKTSVTDTLHGLESVDCLTFAPQDTFSDGSFQPHHCVKYSNLEDTVKTISLTLTYHGKDIQPISQDIWANTTHTKTTYEKDEKDNKTKAKIVKDYYYDWTPVSKVMVYDKDKVSTSFTGISIDKKTDYYFKIKSQLKPELFKEPTKFDITAIDDKGNNITLDPWLNASYKFKRQAQIDYGGNAVSSLPTVLNLTFMRQDTVVLNITRTDCTGLIFTNDAETNELNYAFDNITNRWQGCPGLANSANGTPMVWVSTALNTTINTTIYAYMDNQTTKTQTKDVWDSRFIAVYHFNYNKTSNGLTGTLFDAKGTNDMYFVNGNEGGYGGWDMNDHESGLYMSPCANLCDQSSSHTHPPNSILQGLENWTISAWFQQGSTNVNKGVLGGGDGISMDYISATSSWDIIVTNGTVTASTLQAYISNNVWGPQYYITITKQSNTLKLYVNGTLKQTVTDAPKTMGSAYANNPFLFETGCYGADELWFLNVALTADEIRAVFDNQKMGYGNYGTFNVSWNSTENQIVGDTTSPVINITAPLHNQNLTFSAPAPNYVKFNYSISDETNLSYCYYGVTGEIANTNIGLTQNNFTAANITLTVNSTNHNHILNVWCNNTANNIATAQVNFSTNSLPYITSYNYSGVEAGKEYNFTLILADAENDLQWANITLILWNETVPVSTFFNGSMTSTNNLTFRKNLTIPESIANVLPNHWQIIYYWGDNYSTSQTFSNLNPAFNLTLAYPSIKFDTGTTTTGGNYNMNNSLIINVTASDTHYSNMTIYVFNSSSPYASNFTTYTNLTWQPILADGTYYFNATALDIYGNSNSTATRNITIDTTLPGIYFDAGTTVSGNLTTSVIAVFANASDLHYANMTFYLYNSAGLYTSASTSQNNYSVFYVTLPDDTYYFNVTASDTFGNSNSTATRSVIIDATAPNVIYDTGTTADGSTGVTSLTLNLTASDTHYSNMTINVYNSTGIYESNFTTSRNLQWTLALNTSVNTYYFNATATDMFGLKGSAATRSVSTSTPSAPSGGGGGGGGYVPPATNLSLLVSNATGNVSILTPDIWAQSIPIGNKRITFYSGLLIAFIVILVISLYFIAKSQDEKRKKKSITDKILANYKS